MNDNNNLGFRYIRGGDDNIQTWAEVQVKITILDAVMTPPTEDALDAVRTILLQERGPEYLYLAPYALGLRSN